MKFNFFYAAEHLTRARFLFLNSFELQISTKCILCHNLHQQVVPVHRTFAHNQHLCFNSIQGKGKRIDNDLSKAHGTMLLLGWSISKMQMRVIAILVKCLRKIPQKKVYREWILKLENGNGKWKGI